MDSSTSRRRLLRLVAGAGAAAAAGCVSGPNETPTSDPAGSATDPPGTASGIADAPALALSTVASGLRAAVDVAFAPDADRRYVAQQTGEVLVHEDGAVRDRPFLDLGDAVTTGGEKGLLGVALHPAFGSNRRVYVRYSAPSREGTPDDYSHTFVLAEFTAGEDGRRVDPDSERTVVEIPQPQANHNAGDLLFGPEGLLYVAVGDGGGAGDRGRGHVEDWYDTPGGNGQDVEENLLGSVLRIDVDGGDPYAVPEDNPLVGETGLDEQYTWGLRNPWRMSVDPDGGRVGEGPDLYVGDVGQDRFEEVDLVRRGGNYGWNVREATRCYRADDCPSETPGGESLVDPVVEYPHSGAGVSGISVIGGYVYRGDAVPELDGRYVFGDYRAAGQLFVADPADGVGWSADVLDVDDGGRLDQLRSFGRDRDGELYVLASGGDGWGLHRLVAA
jgi:glucose/arabinose dehydrogenase